MKTLCIAYAAVMTVALLVQNPLDWLGGSGLLVEVYSLTAAVVHFILFAVLAVLVIAARFPLAARWQVAVLVAYAGLTEAAQALVPLRQPEWIDLVENLLGLAAGAAVWWGIGAVGNRYGNVENRHHGLATRQAAVSDVDAAAAAHRTP